MQQDGAAMIRPLTLVLAAIAVFALLLPGCARRLPDATTSCDTDADCEAGGVCVDNSCTGIGPGTIVPCDGDEECGAGESCVNNACTQVGSTSSTTCSVVSDCTSDQFCNTSTGQCQALLDGWCRESTQCAAPAAICSAPDTNSLGRCVECLRDADCGSGGRCVQPGVCENTGTGGDTNGGTNGGDTNGGETNGGTNGGDTNGTGNGGTGDICADNGWYGDGTCDTTCPQPDPDCEGGTNGGGNGGDTGDLCQDLGWYGDGICDDFCPNPDPDCTGGGGGGGGSNNNGGTSDFCEEYGWYGDGFCDSDCPQPDPDCGGGSGTDECETNGWYGDGICDSFCPQPDPDCGGGGGTGTEPGENEACVTQDGQVMECAGTLECIAVSDGAGIPAYGACKQICNSDAECGGRACALGFLSDGSGVCGSPLTLGQTGCTFWEQGDNFCFDPTAPTGEGTAFLECLNGTCQFVCDYDGNLDGAWTCPNGGFCSSQYQPYDGFNVDLAICQ
jgi:hypothetical protein